MTDAATVPTDGNSPALPELPSTVVATLPPCPAWCDRDHSGWGTPRSAMP